MSEPGHPEREYRSALHEGGPVSAGDRADFDVAIVGAGLVGLALAPALAPTGLRVALADRAAIRAPDEPAPGADWDARIYAISPGSAAFLQSIGAWQALSRDRIQPIEAMRVEGDDGGVLNFSAYEQGERALAWIVEERALRAALVPLVHAAGVAIEAPSAFTALGWADAAAVLQRADGTPLSARLVVGADGVRSWVRQAAGIAVTPKPYGQTAVVANFACERAHHGRAWQWFRADGAILAWLPLPGRRISIVWSAPEREAQELLGEPPAALAARVAAAGGHALGALECITPAAGFPLQLVRVPTVVATRLALVGDAAHGVHPLAGQGVNLGFGDVETLAAVLRDRGPVADPGAALLLERYARRRAEPVAAMQAVTDGLARLFGTPAPWARRVRNLGLAAVERLPLAKHLLVHSALG
jgi:ubiquinone biosynthesis UbiH/UbiF/VisC/COQ6 family hydroxylase